MDGTFYLDTQILDGSLDFLRQVERLGKRYVFFTNNSSKSSKTYIDKLANMDCYIQRDQIITSGDVMIEYLKEYYPGKTVYLVGTPDLEENFRENGILLTKAMPDVVVIGFDMISGTDRCSLRRIWISTVRQGTALSRTVGLCVQRSHYLQENSRSTWENRLRRLLTWS